MKGRFMNFKDSLDIAQFKLRNHLVKLVWAIMMFLLASYLSFLFSSHVTYQQWAFLDEKYFPLSLSAIRIVFWIILFLVTLPIVNLIVGIFKRGVEYEFKVQDWPREWIHHGGVKATTQPAGLEIKHSATGCLLQKYYWRDFPTL